MLPPLPVQMQRIAAYLGYKNTVESVKPEEDKEELSRLMESMPVAPAVQVMSQEEYLKMKESKNG